MIIKNRPLIDLVDNRNNNFNLLRFGAALTVILSHSFILTNTLPNSWPKILGFLAVNCFFLLSGFLVTKSLLDRNSLSRFIIARVLRIYPALVMAVLFCALVIGPWHTSLPLGDYFTSGQTLKFILSNGSLLGGTVEDHLPGVFNHQKVNAPLWTLFYEIYLYGLLALIALVFGIRSSLNIRWFSITVFVLSAVLFVLFIADIAYQYINNHIIASLVRFGALFGIGSSLFLFRSKIKLNVTILLMILLLVVIASVNRMAFNCVTYLFLGYVLLYLAYMPSGFVLQFNKLGDYSYGLYIYAYPIQQSIVHRFPMIGVFEHVFFSVVVALIFAVISWHVIESSALKFKEK